MESIFVKYKLETMKKDVVKKGIPLTWDIHEGMDK